MAVLSKQAGARGGREVSYGLEDSLHQLSFNVRAAGGLGLINTKSEVSIVGNDRSRVQEGILWAAWGCLSTGNCCGKANLHARAVKDATAKALRLRKAHRQSILHLVLVPRLWGSLTG